MGNFALQAMVYCAAMKKKTYTYLLLGLVLLVSGISVAGAWPWDPLEEQLLEALKKKNLNKFEKLLKKGADPNAILGTEADDWVMCLATDKGNEDFLKLAVEYGGDANLRNLPAFSSFSAPLLCAMALHNYDAFMFLLDHGADLDMKINPNAKPIPKSIHTRPEKWGKILYEYPVTDATVWNEYHMVYEIMQRKDLNKQELDWLKRSIEEDPIDLKSEHNRWRMKVVELLRQQGHEITPWPEKTTSRK